MFYQQEKKKSNAIQVMGLLMVTNGWKYTENEK